MERGLSHLHPLDYLEGSVQKLALEDDCVMEEGKVGSGCVIAQSGQFEG